jgi:hypothetical protein
MEIKDLNKVVDYFIRYGSDLQDGNKYFHKENDNFKIIITKDNELYQLNTDHEPWGIEIDNIDNLKIRFKSFTGENLEDMTGRWDELKD